MYRAVLEVIEGGPRHDTILVVDSSIVFREPGYAARAHGSPPSDTIPSLLRRGLAEVSRKRMGTRSLGLPATLRVLSPGELGAIFQRGPNEGWAEFRQRFPGPRAFYGFTPVAFNRDSTQAYLYYEYHCGGLCGGGDGVWLLRDRETRVWRLHRRVNYWIS